MRARSPRHAVADEVYAWLSLTLVRGRCQVCARLPDRPQYLCGGYGEATELHHLRKRSSAGALADPANVVRSCRAGNRAVEDYPEAAHDAGLVVRPCCPEWEQLGARAWADRWRGMTADEIIDAMVADGVGQ